MRESVVSRKTSTQDGVKCAARNVPITGSNARAAIPRMEKYAAGSVQIMLNVSELIQTMIQLKKRLNEK